MSQVFRNHGHFIFLAWVTYPWPKDSDNNNEMSYDGKKPCWDKAADSRHPKAANIYFI